MPLSLSYNITEEVFISCSIWEAKSNFSKINFLKKSKCAADSFGPRCLGRVENMEFQNQESENGTGSTKQIQIGDVVSVVPWQ